MKGRKLGGTWIHQFTFWGYPKPGKLGTRPYSVGYTNDEWGRRFKVTKGTNAGGGEWRHLVTFWAFQSKVIAQWRTE